MILIKPKGYSLLSNSKLTYLSFSSVVFSLLQGYENLFPKVIPSGMPSLREIEHLIDFLSGSHLPHQTRL